MGYNQQGTSVKGRGPCYKDGQKPSRKSSTFAISSPTFGIRSFGFQGSRPLAVHLGHGGHDLPRKKIICQAAVATPTLKERAE